MERETEIIVSLGEVRVGGYRTLKRRYRLGQLILGLKRKPQIVVRVGIVWLEPKRLLVGSRGGFESL